MKIVRALSVAISVAVILGAAPQAGPNAAFAAATAVPKAKPTLMSHKATYRLTLLKTRPGDGVRSTRGTMTYTLADRCDGYTIESNVAMTMSYADGASQKMDQRYAAWEAKNGRSSTFTMQTLEDGAPSKSYRGSITLEQDGSGSAVYEGDKTETFKLAPGTMLSTAHTLALLEEAAAGKRFLSRQVIDGSFDQGPFVVSAAIASGRDGRPALDKDGMREISGGRYWPMSLAYFPASSRETMPEYELVMDLMPSGISRAMTQDFGAFTIGFTLVEVEELKPEC